MDKKTIILIANENEEESKEIAKKLEQSEESYEIMIAKNGTEALDVVKKTDINLLLCDIVLSGVDGFEVIEMTKEFCPKSKIIVISNLSNDGFMKKAMSYGVDYYMLKPVSTEILSKRVSELCSKQGKYSDIFDFKEVDEKLTNIFITVGIPAHIKGYQFLREAIKLAMEKPEMINSITKKLYPSIAEKFDTSASKVERAIRHAIEVAWNKGRIGNINDIFGLNIYEENEKPTNSEFIALVADKMLLDGSLL